jgi:hypothetical protein
MEGTCVAKRTWHGVAPDGAEREVTIAIGQPILQAGGEWRSNVTLGCLDTHVARIAGIDSWQALQLGMQFAAARVAGFAEDGWEFYWEQGGDPADPADLVKL